MSRYKTIFVSIAAFNEADLYATIRNAKITARHPERIFFGVFYHQTNGVFKDLEELSNVMVSKHAEPYMLGVGASRSIANKHYNNEDYYLQIDAHTIFDYHWDELLINGFEEIKKSGIEKPVISCYLPDWTMDERGDITLSPDTGQTASLVWDYDQMRNSFWNIPIMSTKEVDWYSNKESFYQHYGIAAHFIFAQGEFCKELVPDKELMFYGEEPTLALRAFDAGYKIFVTRNTYLWHKNKILSYNPSYDRINFSPDRKDLKDEALEKDRKSLNRTRQILCGELLGPWGASTLESLNEYQRLSKINFKDFYDNMRQKSSDGVLWYE